MYSVSQEMPLDSFQVIQNADNITDFTGGQVCRLRIPRSVGYFDSHLSRLNFLVSTQDANYKMCFVDPVVGVASMIDMIRISQNGVVISEVLEYATLQRALKTSTRSLSALQRDAGHKGIVDYEINADTGDKALSSSVLLGSALAGDGSDGMASAQQQIKFQLELDFISLFEVLQVVPVAVMGDLLVEIRFVQQNKDVLKVLPATGLRHTCTALVQAETAITLTPPFVGFTNLGDSPFVKGMRIKSSSGSQEYEITAMSQAPTTGVITLTVGTAIDATDAGDTFIKIFKGTNNNEIVADAKYVVNRVDMALQVVKPPDEWKMQLAQQIQSEGLTIDTDSYTTYRSTILSAIKNQTITLPTTQARAKAIFCVPRSQLSGGAGDLGGLSNGATGKTLGSNTNDAYSAGDVVDMITNTGSGRGARIRIVSVNTGQIATFAVVFRGSGYQVGDELGFGAGSGGGTATLTIDDATGLIAESGSLKLTNQDDRKLGGEWSELAQYRWQINGKYYPTQPISLGQFLGGWHFSQEHLRELEKAFEASGLSVESHVGAKQSFVIARALAKYGASMDLSDRPVNLYLEYDKTSDPATAKDVVSFVHHNVRIMVSDMGIEVMA
jgi:hypothetical protein